jgi:hypothetical protein
MIKTRLQIRILTFYAVPASNLNNFDPENFCLLTTSAPAIKLYLGSSFYQIQLYRDSHSISNSNECGPTDPLSIPDDTVRYPGTDD